MAKIDMVHEFYERQHPKHYMLNYEDRAFVCGCEYEIEAIIKNPPPSPLYTATKDGSLRNNGVEYITIPLGFKKSIEVFEDIHKKLVFGPGDPYSERTSIHVHVNVDDMSMDELRRFVLLYVLFEPAFFHFAGEKRQNNIHCVPLTYTALAAGYGNSIHSQVVAWSKYTAFNLLPVRGQGSVEFRHLGGTGDVNRYVKWLTMIKDLREASLDDRSIILSRILGTRQNITELYASIFGHLCPLPEGAFARSLIDVKEALIKTQAKKLESLLQKAA